MAKKGDKAGDRKGDRLGLKKAGRKSAKKLQRRLNDDDFRKKVGFTDDQIKMLDRIASGRPPRNALAIMQAFKLKAEYGYSKPKQVLEVDDKRDVPTLLREANARQRRIAMEEDGEVEAEEEAS